MFDYLYIITQTNLLELPIYYFFVRRYLNIWQCIFVVTLANSLTHPLVFFGFLGSHQSYFSSTLTAEAFAPLIEAMILVFAAGLSWKRSLAASLAANLFSWQVAPIITYLLFFPASRIG